MKIVDAKAMSPTQRVREDLYRLAAGKVLDALRKRPLTRGQVLAGPLRGTGYCLPADRDELLKRLVAEGIVVEVQKPGASGNYRNAIYRLAEVYVGTEGGQG